MYRNPNDEEGTKKGPEDIPEVEVRGKEIKIGKKWYKLIMCYLCPVCEKPIIAYWKVPIKNDRTTPNVVGRALRDSGFGGYRFFETSDGQGFEYDTEKDPRKRHQHSKERSYYYGSGQKYETLWVNFIKLNPLFSINDFFLRTIDPHKTNFKENHAFVTSQSRAVNVYINKMRDYQDTFKVIDDKLRHGKPLFYFNLVTWEDKTRWDNNWDERLERLKEWFGDEAMKTLNIVSDFEVEED